MKYRIAVEEKLRREVVVEADSLDDAVEAVKNLYYAEEIVLDADDVTVDEYGATATFREVFD